MTQVPVIFGEVLFDCFEDGSRVLGGAPFNVAWHLQAFGCAPLFVSRVGTDAPGQEIIERMQQWGMDTSGMQHDPVHPTGEVRVTVEQGQPSYEILAERAYDYIRADELPALQPSLVYQGTLGLRQAASAATLESLLARQPAPVFLDVNLRPPWWERGQVLRQLDHAHWVKINDDELCTLQGGDTGLEERAMELMGAHGIALVIVTRGADGAFAMDESGSLVESRPASGIKVVDTVGAGDAFAAVCILGLLNDWPQAQIMERAQSFASRIVGQRGATAQDHGLYASIREDWQLAVQA